VFEAHGTRIVRTPIQSPEANGIAERFVQAARSECVDWLLIMNAQHLVHTLTVFIDHYNGSRHRRSLDLLPPGGRPSPATWAGTQPIEVKTSRPFGRTHSRMRAYGVSRIEFLHRTGSFARA